MSQGGGTQQKKCVHERVQCHVHVFFSSVTVSQCHREGVQGGGGLQLAGQGTSAYCRQAGSTVYSIQSTVVKGLPYTVDCRHWQKNTHVHPDMCMCTCMC